MKKTFHFLMGMVIGMTLVTYSKKIQNKLNKIKDDTNKAFDELKDNLMEGEDIAFYEPKVTKNYHKNNIKTKRQKLD